MPPLPNAMRTTRVTLPSSHYRHRPSLIIALLNTALQSRPHDTTVAALHCTPSQARLPSLPPLPPPPLLPLPLALSLSRPLPCSRPSRFQQLCSRPLARSFSGGGGEQTSDEHGSSSSLASRWAALKPRLISYLWIGGALIVGVVVLRTGLYVLNFFTTLDFADVGEAAFAAGCLTGLALAGVVALTKRALTLRPEPVFQAALKEITSDATVRGILGADLKIGSFRAYTYVPAALRVPSKSAVVEHSVEDSTVSPWSLSSISNRFRRFYSPRRLQLFFLVTGNEGVNGIASAEVSKWKGTHMWKLLCVDVIGSNQRIILRGDVNYSLAQPSALMQLSDSIKQRVN